MTQSLDSDSASFAQTHLTCSPPSLTIYLFILNCSMHSPLSPPLYIYQVVIQYNTELYRLTCKNEEAVHVCSFFLNKVLDKTELLGLYTVQTLI